MQSDRDDPGGPFTLFRDAGYLAGVAAYRRGDFAQAVASFRAQVESEPRYLLAWRGLGEACLAAGRHHDALAAFENALRIDPGCADAWYDRGTTLMLFGRDAEAADSFGRALAAGAPPALAAMVHLQRGTLLHLWRRLQAALEDYDRALALAPDDLEARLRRALVLNDLGRGRDALEEYDQVLRRQPDHAGALHAQAAILRSQTRFDEALAAYDRALAIEPGRPELRGMRLLTKAMLCDWRDREADLADLRDALARGEPAAAPFVASVMIDDPALLRQVAERWARDRDAAAGIPAAPRLPPRRVRERERIRLGYFSADFHAHATTYLTAELFGLHDRGRFEVVAFSFGPKPDQATRDLLAGGFDRFEEVGALADAAITARARALGIDIAIDLKGYTDGERAQVFARRAAPVQVNYLGYPGTMGAPYIDYLLADRVIVPDGSRRHYAEQVVRLPGSYQVNDRRRVFAAPAPPRRALGLPDAGVVFCCFNRVYKVTPETFGAWMRILAAVEGSVLWMLEEHPVASRNLRQAAAAHGIDPDRLVFAPLAPIGAHLIRLRAADLFLDTLPCNAHTTASDALWMGVPVITCSGRSFAARVAASLLHAVGLAELVTDDAAGYEALAIALARDPARRARLRDHLARDPTRLPLFDTPSFARGLETAFERMHARHQAGLPPEAFDVDA